MEKQTQTEVIIIGGSYAGLSAAMALGRARRRVVVLDSGQPCNRQTPRAHNFITQDGQPPQAIRDRARQQVLAYPSVTVVTDEAVAATRQGTGFVVSTASGVVYAAAKILFATGVKDLMPAWPGFAECWGISVLHCPYCHGYEVGDQPLGVVGNGDLGFEFARLLRQWSPRLTLFTNGPATLSPDQAQRLEQAGIRIAEAAIDHFDHTAGHLRHVVLTDTTQVPLAAMFARVPFELPCLLPVGLGCVLSETGHIQVDEMQRTSVPGVFAAGDATTPMRSVAVAVAAGSKAGSFLNHELVAESL
ncbi:NAD(P)/FAD-dependent oxidoreductase [Hymenobacter metallicola]|uniref:NAD(P)/FAD-dependent oxidoreductase n=1 Tax=Hymenobacter metallicola TaxID=2563114 RepID=A0A4Z0QGU6_9BACT|nr:NAD(P)/FAD-dependent oxidoreductase [Hymenobacter metallicola]TGE29277.1 NAD(P)/FAD-dependent oxidoreductase [Hymenobacter metallicola]